MKLYYSPGACSLSPHIALREAGLTFETEKVDLRLKTTASGADYNTINPKGYVPALQLDDGTVLTEGPAIVQYIADRVPSSKLAPAAGSMDRYRLQEWLGFINSEVHKSFSPLFDAKTPAETSTGARERLHRRFATIDAALAGKSYLLGEQFSVADGYLFTVLSWADHVKLDVSEFANLAAFRARVAARPAVKATLVAEGLMKAA
jgi:glutathione S-transferase